MQRSLFDDIPGSEEHGGSFHLRNDLPREQVEHGEAVARSQEAVILRWFQDHPLAIVTAPELAERAGLRCLMTSVRRALTNLKDKGHLEKLSNQQREGLYGVNNVTWRLKGG